MDVSILYSNNKLLKEIYLNLAAEAAVIDFSKPVSNNKILKGIYLLLAGADPALDLNRPVSDTDLLRAIYSGLDGAQPLTGLDSQNNLLLKIFGLVNDGSVVLDTSKPLHINEILKALAVVWQPEPVNQTILITRNPDTVEAGGYVAISTGTPNLAITPTRTFFNRQNLSLIRQTGNISRVRFYLGNALKPSAIHVEIWRKNGSVWDRVYRSEDIAAVCIINQINDINVNPIAVLAGDYLALSGNGGGNIFTAVSGYGSGSFHYQTEASIQVTGFNWTTQPTLTGYLLPVKSFQQAPLVVGIGDSIMAGHPGHYSGVESSVNVNVPTNCITGQLERIDEIYICQNMGIGSQVTTSIAARFNADVVALKPRLVIINGGVNDIATGVSKSVFLANYTSMLNLCAANGIIAIVCKITPWTTGTIAQMQTRDNWMADLKVMVESYQGFIWVDFDSVLGQFRSGGDAGNLWNIQPAYNADGIHFTYLGYQAMATSIDAKIKEKYRFE